MATVHEMLVKVDTDRATAALVAIDFLCTSEHARDKMSPLDRLAEIARIAQTTLTGAEVTFGK